MVTVAENGGAGRARFASSPDDVGQTTLPRPTQTRPGWHLDPVATYDEVNWRAPRLPHAPATCSACTGATPKVKAPGPRRGRPPQPVSASSPLPKIQPPAPTSTPPADPDFETFALIFAAAAMQTKRRAG
jgi:hypothetical protein